jgi:TRAP-type uncharacterized transport system fused permease subunit
MRSKWALVALVLAVWALAASFFAGYYWLQYNDLSQQVSGLRITVNIGVDYGNGTRMYYNDTKAFTGETVLTVTKRVTSVETATSSFGIYVTSINGLAAQDKFGWTYWPWNSTGKSWDFAPVGADVYQIVANGDTFLWYYQNSFNPPP